MTQSNSWMTCPAPPLDPPEDDPECPECDKPLRIVTKNFFECDCGWVSEPDWSQCPGGALI